MNYIEKTFNSIGNFINLSDMANIRFRIMMIIIIILLVIIITEKETFKRKEKKTKENQKGELYSREVLDFELTKILKKKNIHIYDKMWLSCKKGLLRGGLTGYITGGFMGGITGGLLFATVNPFLVYINE
jgi:hypothetical protein